MTRGKPANDPGFIPPFPLPSVTAAEKRRARSILDALESTYPNAKCALNFTTPAELLIATILSAQATDVSVNKATPALFARFSTPAAYAAAAPADIEPYIRTIGLFRNKAKAVQSAMKDVAERFGGQVPRTMEDLLTLRGVARKTANVVLGNAYSMNFGFVVDTHIERVSKRFALAEWTDPVAKVERRLMALFPRQRWCDLSHMIISHGRQACRARLPSGTRCQDNPLCKKFGAACECREQDR